MRGGLDARRVVVAIAAGLLALSPRPAAADDAHDHGPGRPDGHAPISVMGEHMHSKGEWMLSYRFVFMEMDGNRHGSERISVSDVRTEFPVSPTDMDMEMHMLGLMYAPADWLTLMGMLPFTRKDMDHVSPAGRFTTRSHGIGDVKLSGLVRLWDDETHHVHANLGLSFPTGGIHHRDETPMGRVRLPYPMQLGSGTWDALPGVTWTSTWGERWSSGAQVMGTIRFGRNRRGYSLGDRVQVQAWGARVLGSWVSASLRVSYEKWGNVHGRDDALNPMVVPTADPSRRGGEAVDVGLGLNFIVPRGPLRGNRLALEVVRPVHQRLDGPQLETDWKIVLGWQLAF